MPSKIREKDIEKYFREQAKEKGFCSYKFTSPANNGVPDRVVIGHGHTFFVELKAPGQKPRPLQIEVHKRMRSFGAEIYVADTFASIDDILDNIINKNGEKDGCYGA